MPEYEADNRLDKYIHETLDPIAYNRKALREECIRVGITEIFGKPLKGTSGYLQMWSTLVTHKMHELKERDKVDDR